MAKRRTIGDNPLDAVVPYPTTPKTGKSPAAAAQSPDPSTGSTRRTTPHEQPKAKDNHAPVPAAKVTQSPSPPDLVSRIQSLEEQNEYIKWFVGGAILLAIML